MGKTISEKILSLHSGKEVKASDLVLANVDLLMGHDWNTPLTIQVLKEMGVERIFDPRKAVFVVDHAVLSPNEKISAMQKETEEFARRQGACLYLSGQGICHQLLPEQGHVLPGMVVVGCDSHTTTYGALNAFAVGVGSTDLAAALASGQIWLRVPQTIKVNLTGRLPEGVYAKDLILDIIRGVTAEGANYMALEFSGDGVAHISMDGRLTIANMSVEMGAKAALFETDSNTRDWLSKRTSGDFEAISPDPDAQYAGVWEWDLSSIVPRVARPHNVDNVVPVNEVTRIKVHQGILGTCTNGRLEDLKVAAGILKGKMVFPDFRLIVVPASRQVLMEAVRDGTLEILLGSGAIVIPPGCGPCHGASNGVPRDGENVISTANRNFKGRMGNNKASIYLASPATVAASALEGKITDPRNYVE
jgi:3-isopropylmalate/(R)-2-methylmalate dehydratase large subunit